MHWLEYQANLFASVMLMPKLSMGLLARRLFNERERSFGYLWYDDQKENWQRCNDVIRQMSEALNVSKAAVRLRLKKLGLLREDSSSKRLCEIM